MMERYSKGLIMTVILVEVVISYFQMATLILEALNKVLSQEKAPIIGLAQTKCTLEIGLGDSLMA